jgi:hypothetical protein
MQTEHGTIPEITSLSAALHGLAAMAQSYRQTATTPHSRCAFFSLPWIAVPHGPSLAMNGVKRSLDKGDNSADRHISAKNITANQFDPINGTRKQAQILCRNIISL